jgi:peroxiredoxin family protein
LFLENNYKIKDMKNIQKIVASVVIASTLASCGAAGPMFVTNNGSVGSKKGEASYKAKFIMLKPIDLGVIAAARKGNIKKIATVDWRVKGRVISTVVTGE